jgi:chloramphenicol 3-O phosphotransferase
VSGRVIVLNGTSSAGKSTLAEVLQARFAAAGEPWIVIGVDDLFVKLPRDWITIGAHVGAHGDEGIVFARVDGEIERRIGPVGTRVLAAYRGTVAAVARSGVDVIVDEVLLCEEDWHGWQADLAGLAVRWVRVDCALDVVETRERERGDRLVGLARSQYDVVHRHPRYDARVDTATTGPEAAAAAILAALSW